MVFAHGSNDVSISIGPVAAVISTVEGHIAQKNPIPTLDHLARMFWSGAWVDSIRRKVIETVGSGSRP